MPQSHHAVSDGYFLAHDGSSVFVSGSFSAGQVVETGQPRLDVFPTIEELNIWLASFGQPAHQE